MNNFAKSNSDLIKQIWCSIINEKHAINTILCNYIYENTLYITHIMYLIIDIMTCQSIKTTRVNDRHCKLESQSP